MHPRATRTGVRVCAHLGSSARLPKNAQAFAHILVGTRAFRRMQAEVVAQRRWWCLAVQLPRRSSKHECF